MRQGVDLPSDKMEIKQISTALRAISHPTRLKILCFLGNSEKIVNEILEHTGSTQSNISQHLEVLRKANVVQSRRSHNKVYCSIRSDDLLPLIENIRELFCREHEMSHNELQLTH